MTSSPSSCPDDAARLPFTETPLPGVDPAWSRVVTVASTAPVEPVPGRKRRWHLLDNGQALSAAGRTPQGVVLAVHGNPTWSYLWRDVVRAATETERPWRVVAVDQLDMGFSERTGLFRRLEDRVTDLGDLTREIGLDTAGLPVVTLAHDWGGLISQGWAQEHPEIHAATVMTNTAVHHDDAEPIPSALRLALNKAVHGPVTTGSTAFLDTTLALCDPAPSKDVRKAYKAPYTTRERREGIAHFVADIPAPPEHPSHAAYERIAGRMSAREVPTLLLWGTGDPVFQQRYLEDLMHRAPHADVHRYEGAKHLVPEARDISTAILTWLDERFGGVDPVVESHRDRRARGRAAFVPFFAELEARRNDDTPAVVDMGPVTGTVDGSAPELNIERSVTWAQLSASVDRLAVALLRTGVRPGDRVNLMVPPGSMLTTLIYACLRIGAVIVVADQGLGRKGLTRALKGSSPQWFVGIRKALVGARALGWPGRRIAADSLDPVSKKLLGVEHTVAELMDSVTSVDPAEIPAVDPDAEAAVLFTSGSTGPAKGVVYTHRQMAGMRDTIRDTYGLRAGTGLVAGFAPFALLGPALGAASVTPDMDVTSPKTLTAQALAEATMAIRATAVFASPAAIENVLATADALSPAERDALARVDLMLSAGAPIPEQLLARLQELMPAAELHTPYGMTEALPLTDVSLDVIRAAREDAQRGVDGAGRGVCVGTPVEGAELGVLPLTADGSVSDEIVTTPGVTGEIVARAPHAKDHYDRLWITERESDLTPGWHRTGDVGHFDARERLWYEGRLAHVITMAQGPVSSVAAEHAAQTVPGVGRVAVVGVGPVGSQSAVAVIETEPRAEKPHLAPAELSERVRATVDFATGLPVSAVLVVPEQPTDIRHNSKIDRTALSGWAERALSTGKLSDL
ncbi:alpha/beta fold hydrolase [Kocuria sp. UBA5001]|uniref:alpha/beta fold hydrolase n=1 Tax=Kocuria sp. UBA5001 TaxID=1946674 RepID=UPI0025C58133|nr:alpha/beta fold hydrolase [Kocuria sp. UBA5001]